MEPKQKQCHNMLCCDSASCWRTRRRATGEDTAHHSTTKPQPPINTTACTETAHLLSTAPGSAAPHSMHWLGGGGGKIWSWPVCPFVRRDKTAARGDTRYTLHTREHTTSCSMQIYSPLSGSWVQHEVIKCNTLVMVRILLCEMEYDLLWMKL